MPEPQRRVETGAKQVAKCRRCPTYRMLEGLSRHIALGSGVEEDKPARLPWHLELLDHEVVSLCRRRPMDVAQVVAALVFAESEEVVATRRRKARTSGVHGRVLAADHRKTVQVFDGGIYHQTIDAADRTSCFGHRQRVPHHHTDAGPT